VGHSPDGEAIFCTCRLGLGAHMNHLAYLMQEQAETLARLDAMRKPLPLYLARTYTSVSIEFKRCKDEYDALEAQYWQGREEASDESQPNEGTDTYITGARQPSEHDSPHAFLPGLALPVDRWGIR